MELENYLTDLAAALQRRGAEGQRISDAVAEIEARVKDSGEDPVVAFGSPDAYAEQVMLRDERSQQADWDWRTFRATAFDEMALLADAGRQGWELVDVGFYALHCKRPRDIQTHPALNRVLAHRYTQDRRDGRRRSAACAVSSAGPHH